MAWQAPVTRPLTKAPSTRITRTTTANPGGREQHSSPSLSHTNSTQHLFAGVVAPHTDWKVEKPLDTLAFPTPEQTRNPYTEDFVKNPHSVLLGMKDNKATTVLTILKNPSVVFPNVASVINLGPSYKSLLIDKDGYEEFYLYNVALKQGSGDAGTEFAAFANQRALGGMNFYPVSNPSVINDLLQLEAKHSLKVDKMKVAVLYAKEGQSDIKEIFTNQPPEDHQFWKFMKDIATQIDLASWTGYRGDMGKSGTDVDKPGFYTKDWNEVEIMFHLAPYMDAEQHRRLVGNDIAVIIYYDCADSNKPFIPFGSTAMGIVPHVFAVVQPHSRGGAYRVGFFQRANVPEHGPPCPPENHYFNTAALKNYLFTKIYNGYAKARTCPPMRTLFSVPRSEAINDLHLTYPKGGGVGLAKSVSTRGGVRGGTLKQEKYFLKVICARGKDLASKDSNGLSDPYLKINTGNASKKLQKTDIKYKTLNPEWNQTLCFEVNSTDMQVTDLNVTCMDHDDLGSDDYMGSFSLFLKDLQMDKEFRWYPLSSTTGEFVSGEIALAFELSQTKT